MAPGRRHKTSQRGTALLLWLALLLSLGGLIRPWVQIDAGPLLFFLALPSRPVAGWRLPLLALDSSHDALLQGGAAATELLTGHPDRAAARLLFGERFEAELAPLVWLPALWCLLGFLLGRRRPRRGFVWLLLPGSLLILSGLGWGAFQLSTSQAGGPLSPALQLQDGVWLTAGAQILVTLWCFSRLRRNS